MSTVDEIRQEVKAIFATNWEKRDGLVIPDSDSVELGNDAIELDATVLYADMVDSTQLVDNYYDHFAAEIYKAYLVTACRIIRRRGGEITAFDGDRVMGVFIGDYKNSWAARAALNINWAVDKIINPAIKAQYPKTSFQVEQAVAVDTSHLLVAKTGIRGSNDLVWVGRAANYAAKLCGLRQGYSSYITEAVFKRLNEDSKYGGTPPQLMWTKLMWDEMGTTIYGSTWWWQP